MNEYCIFRRISEWSFASCNIIVLWLIGLICGTLSGRNIWLTQFSGINMPLSDSRSFFLLLCFQLLPIFIVWFIAHKGAYYVLFPLIFLRSFCYSLSSAVITKFYGSAVWLVYRILFFSNILNSLLFLWLCLKYVSINRQPSIIAYGFVFSAIIAVCVFDYSFISSYCIYF